ncbi:hypothetical protein [uncultured Kordia sp.]|uniref:hypothetical protein n=1 Tax=uncultured Kordia sp. TaxID=507699 RepID=UPI002619EADD|nr:hypothetical protein [uncultured Kordia sp.]
MDNNKINSFFNDILLDKFILNFVPGLILFFVLSTFIGVSTGQGLTIFLIVTSVSWVLGVLLEMIFFKKAFLTKREGKAFTHTENLNLLFGKIGISILIACIFWIDIESVLYYFKHSSSISGMKTFLIILKFVFFALAGLFLYLNYLKSRIKE